MNSFDKEIVFHLPGLCRFAHLYSRLLTYYTEKNYYFKDNIKIGSVYGSPTVIWNGGRIVDNLFLNTEQLTEIKDMMEHFKIPARFTFTNCLLEEKHTYDTYGNTILEIFNTGNNEIICNSEVLENYIRNNYGDKYKYISSTTKRLSNKEKQKKEIEKDYYLIVLDYDYNKDLKYLKSIKRKDKCEILCNPVCGAKCPYRIQHYHSIAEAQLSFDRRKMMHCQYVGGDTIWQSMKEDNFISIKDINNIYLPMGFTNFKLEGRAAHPLDLVEVLLYYLIKEEYQREMRTYLQDTLW